MRAPGYQSGELDLFGSPRSIEEALLKLFAPAPYESAPNVIVCELCFNRLELLEKLIALKTQLLELDALLLRELSEQVSNQQLFVRRVDFHVEIILLAKSDKIASLLHLYNISVHNELSFF